MPFAPAIKTASPVPIVIVPPVIVGVVIEIEAETVAAFTFKAFTNQVVTVLPTMTVTCPASCAVPRPTLVPTTNQFNTATPVIPLIEKVVAPFISLPRIPVGLILISPDTPLT